MREIEKIARRMASKTAGPAPAPGERWLMIPDLQLLPGAPVQHLAWIGQYVRDLGNAVGIIQMGDAGEFASLSSYESARKKDWEKRTLSADLEALNVGFEVLQAALGDWPGRRVWLAGNHDDPTSAFGRPGRWREANPDVADLLRAEAFAPVYLGWEVVGGNREFRFGGGITAAHYFPVSATGAHVKRDNGMGAPHPLAQHRYTLGSSLAGHRPGLLMQLHETARGIFSTVIAGSCYRHTLPYEKIPPWQGVVVLNDCRDGHFDPMPVSLDYLHRRYGAAAPRRRARGKTRRLTRRRPSR